MLAVLLHTRLKFAANVRNIKNVGFPLKSKSNDDKESMRGIARMMEQAKAEEKQSKESRNDNHQSC